jgi:hypothetical protein
MKKIKSLVIIIIPLVLLTSCSDFNEKGKPLFKNLTILYNQSLSKCKITQEVWSTAIYDKKYALTNSNKYQEYHVADFNEAIARMEGEQEIKYLNDQIDLLRASATSDVEKITDKKNDSYEKLILLYSKVIELSKKATSPSGNLQSYAKDLNEEENQINMLITEIKARNPDFEIGVAPQYSPINPQYPTTSFK